MNNIHGGYSDINPSACSTLNGGKQITQTAPAEFAVSEGKIHNTTVPLATVGGDVCWITAPSEYVPYDQAINFTEAHPSLGVHAHFSSVDRWAAALFAANESYSDMASSDEFPYGDWVGNFVTRPLYKRHIRSRHAIFHAANRMLAALPAARRIALSAQLNQMWKAVSVVQHHDSITGTAKPIVFANYNQWLHWGAGKAAAVMAVALQDKWGGEWDGALCDEEYAGCPGVLVCNALQRPLIVNASMRIFNPLGWAVNTTVVLKYLPTGGTRLMVTDEAGWPVLTQPDGAAATGRGKAVAFRVLDVPPLSYKGFSLAELAAAGDAAQAPIVLSSRSSSSSSGGGSVMENEFLTLQFAPDGQLQSVTDRASGVTTAVEVQLGWYNSTGDMFAWNTDGKGFHRFNEQPQTTQSHGAVFQQVTTKMVESNVTLTLRLPEGSPVFEVIATVGAHMTIAEAMSKMVAVRFQTQIATQGSFYTDSNGMGLLKRQSGVAARNTYPSVSYSLINDTKSGLFVLNDRAQAAQSVVDGSLEFAFYDTFDIESACGGAGCRGPKLRSYGTVETKLRCGVGTPSAVRVASRQLATRMRYPPTVMVAPQHSGATNHAPEASCAGVPANVHVQTLQPFAALFDEPMDQGTPCSVRTSTGELIDLSSLTPTAFAVQRPLPPPPAPAPAPPPAPLPPPFDCPDAPVGHEHCQTGCVSTPVHGCDSCISRPWTSEVSFKNAFSKSPNVTVLQLWNTLNKKTSRGPCCGNTFSETAQKVSAVGFELALLRTDKKSGFGAQLHVQWLACPADGSRHPAEDKEQTMTNDVYTVGFCNLLRCPIPGEQQNFGFALRTQHLGQPMCDRSWPGPLAPTPLRPRIVRHGGQDEVVLTSQAINDDGIASPQVSGELEVVLRCDPDGKPGVATATNATLISDGDESAHYVPSRLVFSSRCACPGGCPPPPPPAPSAGDDRTVRSPAAPILSKATMPSDGSFIVRLQHLFGSAESVGTLLAPSTVDLAALFCGSGQTIAQVQEVSMSANRKLTDIHHWRWRRRGDGTVYREQQ